MSPEMIKAKLKDLHARPTITEEEVEVLARENAAVKIQRAWRAKRRASYLGTDFLWTDLITHARFKVDRDAAAQGKNTARERWRRAIFLVLRLQDGNTMLADEQVEHADASRKYLETQHWLEMIDVIENIVMGRIYYHRRWQQEDTTDNFFQWLDNGAGKELSLKECPREQLEKERIAYLSPAQRLNYLVQIDSDGKLRWARTGEVVDTTPGMWKDSGSGKGIVPIDHPEAPHIQHRTSFVMPARGMHPSNSSLNDATSAGQIHYYLGPRPAGSRLRAWMWRNLTPRGLLERLLRRTIQKDTWIYVSDKHFNIFLGVKTAGKFQHSSFLGGGLVTSAGLISVKDGVIHKLSPLSGHYRTSIQHFRYFIGILEERGVDMHKVEISKAEAALWGLEHIAKFKKKQAKMVNKSKRKAQSTIRHAQKPFHRHHKDGENLEGKETSQNGLAGSASPHPRSRTSSFGRSRAGNGAHETGPVEHDLCDEHTDFPAHAPGSPTVGGRAL